jgi:hypothetical protein
VEGSDLCLSHRETGVMLCMYVSFGIRHLTWSHSRVAESSNVLQNGDYRMTEIVRVRKLP